MSRVGCLWKWLVREGLTGRERRVLSSGGIVEEENPTRSEGSKLLKMASSTGTNCWDMLLTTR